MRRMRIGTAAVLVALAALDLTLMRGLPTPFFLVPFIAIMFVSLNLVLVQFLVLRKSLSTFHLAFIGTGFLYVAVTFSLRTRILENVITWYRSLTGDTTIWRFNSSTQDPHRRTNVNHFLGPPVLSGRGRPRLLHESPVAPLSGGWNL